MLPPSLRAALVAVTTPSRRISSSSASRTGCGSSGAAGTGCGSSGAAGTGCGSSGAAGTGCCSNGAAGTGLYFDTKRRMNVVAKGFTASGDPVQVVGAGQLARCLQHETDHLDGVLFIDRMDRARRKAAMRAIREAEWNNLGLPKVKISPHPMTNGYH